MTNLNEIFGLNQYCGPGVLSALTGKSTDHCAAVISAVSGARQIKAVQIPHLLEAARRLGFEVEEVRPLGRTVYGVLTGLAISGARDSKYILSVPKHVIAVEISANREIYLIDNHTKQPIGAGASARLTQPVSQVFLLKGKTPQQIAEELVVERKIWLKNQISILESQIKIRVSQVEQYRLELELLCSENTTQSS